MEIKIRSAALRKVREEAALEGKNQYSANKTLLEGKWVEKSGGSKRGRPTKDDVNKAAVIEAERKKRVNEDFERMNLNVVDPT